MSDFNSWMSSTAHAAIRICSDPDSQYYGMDGAKRLARECGPALLDFPDGIKNIGSTYSGICVIAYRLKLPIDSKEWFASVREGYEKALAYKKRGGQHLMIGRELIKMIQDNHAEEMPVLVQYRDAGGPYPDGEEAGFHLLYGKMNSGAYDYTWEITYPGITGYLPDGLEPNVIVL